MDQKIGDKLKNQIAIAEIEIQDTIQRFYERTGIAPNGNISIGFSEGITAHGQRYTLINRVKMEIVI